MKNKKELIEENKRLRIKINHLVEDIKQMEKTIVGNPLAPVGVRLVDEYEINPEEEEKFGYFICSDVLEEMLNRGYIPKIGDAILCEDIDGEEIAYFEIKYVIYQKIGNGIHTNITVGELDH